MNKQFCLILLLSIVGLNTSLYAQKVKPVVEKETIKAEQQALLLKKPEAKFKSVKYDDGNVYVGEIIKKFRYGLGTMFYFSGDVYRGEWYLDVISGKGVMTYQNGNIYDGEWEGGIYEGQGKMHFASGAEYNGAWHAGKYEGFGKFIYSTGDIYEGGWKEGRQDGQGKLSYIGGDYYDGGWKDGKRSGEGVYYSASKGRSIKGFWDDNLLSGEGSVIYFKDTTIIAINGVWLDNDRFETEYTLGGKSFKGTVRPLTGDAITGPLLINGRVSWTRANYLEGDWNEGVTLASAGSFPDLKEGRENYDSEGLTYEFAINGGKRDAGAVTLTRGALSLFGSLHDDVFVGPMTIGLADIDKLSMDLEWEGGVPKSGSGMFNGVSFKIAAAPDEEEGVHVFSLSDSEGNKKSVVWTERLAKDIENIEQECAAPVSFCNAVVVNMSKLLACVMKDGKWGAISETGRIFIPMEYDSPDDFSEPFKADNTGFICGMKRIEDNGKFGFISMEGKVVVPLTYDFATDYSENLALVKSEGKWAFLDMEGQVVFEPDFDLVEGFSEGLACVAKDGKGGFIAKDGSIAIPLEYDYAEAFSGGFACVGKNGQYGFINHKGEVVIPLEYNAILTGRILK